MSAIFQLLNPKNTVTINRPLAHAVGLNEAAVYGAIVAKYYWYCERGMLDGGWFYSTAPDLAESTALTEKQQKRCIDNLVRAGLIRCELRGMPAKRSFFVVEDVELIRRLIAQGEAAMRAIKPAAAESYEKKRKPSEPSAPNAQDEQDEQNAPSVPSVPNADVQQVNAFLSAAFGGSAPVSAQDPVPEADIQHDNADSPCSALLSEQAPPKGETLLRQKVGASSDIWAEQHSNKTKINKPNIINLSIPRTRGEDSIDEIDSPDVERRTQERAYYAELIRENTESELLAERSPADAAAINELTAVMVEVVCSAKPTVRVNGEDMPHEVVKSAFLKLDSSHIEYVLEALKNSASDVRNIRSYMITALYNAPATIDSYWKARVSRDMRGDFPRALQAAPLA